jgi:putative ATP-dependent endonuclease of OLD family
MRPVRVWIRNVRGIRDVEVHFRSFTTLIGPNNAGKSAVLDAIRLFYGDLAWQDDRDRPWHVQPDDPSWVEIGYELTPDEAADFNEDLLDDSSLVIRRCFTDDGERHRGDYYSVIPGDDPYPTGWGRVAPRLGRCVFVPAAALLHEQTDPAAASPLGEVLRLAFARPEVNEALSEISRLISELRTALESGPIPDLENAIAQALRPWDLGSEIVLGDISSDFVVENLVSLKIARGSERLSPDSQGSGVQRALMAGLIQGAAEIRAESAGAGRTADFRWVLFEEPEVFLHPSQVSRHALDLGRLAKTPNTAVTITTHDPTLLGGYDWRPDCVVRMGRTGDQVRARSVSPEAFVAALSRTYERFQYVQAARDCFTKSLTARTAQMLESKTLHELDERRATALFADRVIVVEGFSDWALLKWLRKRGQTDRLGPNLGVFDASGKFELHRASSLLSLFGIPHVLVWDEDAPLATDPRTYRTKSCRDRVVWEAISAVAQDPHSSLVGCVRLPGTVEHWLSLNAEREGAWKATNITEALDAAYEQGSALPFRLASALCWH